MKLEVLEKIISSLENNIGKGEKIPDEMAKKYFKIILANINLKVFE